MLTIFIEGEKYQVSKTDNLLKICLSLDFDIPYFCWHPALGSIGSCRQCAIKRYRDRSDHSGELVMSCMTCASDGISIYTNTPEVKHFRKSITELLMINHPHDCPICEEGGSCHLQDMVVMNEQNIRRYRFKKRTHLNQYLGPFISHEMNRCISCYRCVRYYKDYSDGKDFGVYGIRNNLYFGRKESGILESEFSGNLVEVCPTGVFTDKTYSKHYVRKWDMQYTPGVCNQCSIGCNILIGERDGTIRKIENRYHGRINQYFLCDLGRFGYEYMNISDRPREPMKRNENNKWKTLTIDQSVKDISKIFHFSKNVIGIGSSRASMENNFALFRLVGEQNFCMGISEIEKEKLFLILKILGMKGVHNPSLQEVENYDAILVLGEDLTQTAARLALSIRQAVKKKMFKIAESKKIPYWQSDAIKNIGQNARYPLFITSVDRTSLEDISSWSYFAPLQDQARFGFAIANKIDSSSPSVNDLNPKLDKQSSMIAEILIKSEKPLVISGSHTSDKSILSSVGNIVCSLRNIGKKVGVSFAVNNVNSIGLALIGGISLDEMFLRYERNSIDAAIILENDLYRNSCSKKVSSFLGKVKNIIVIDYLRTKIQKKARFILPSTNFSEGSGTVVNQEGRAQRFFRVFDSKYFHDKKILEGWRWLHKIESMTLHKKIEWKKLDHILKSFSESFPNLANIRRVAPISNFHFLRKKPNRKPFRYSGRTSSLDSNIDQIYKVKDPDSIFTFSTEGNNSPNMPIQYLSYVWVPGWNSIHALTKFQDRSGRHIKYGDPGILLIKKNSEQFCYFRQIPVAFSEDIYQKGWCVVPYWNLFGSEETSQFSKSIQERMPKPYVVLGEKDANLLNITDSSIVSIDLVEEKIQFSVRISRNLCSGQIGISVGLPGVSPILSSYYVKKIKKVII